jgi:hypothetical protein
MKLLSIGIAAVAQIGLSVQDSMAQSIELSKPSVIVMLTREIPEIDRWFEVSNNVKDNPVLRIEFTSASDLRQGSKALDAAIYGRAYVCELGEDNGPSYEADIISDERGMIGIGGTGYHGAAATPSSDRRYHVYIDPLPQPNLEGVLQKEYSLETLSKDLCFVVEANLETATPVSRALVISSDAVRSAWVRYSNN